MTDLMKLADDYAASAATTPAPTISARAALQSAIEALQAENAGLRSECADLNQRWAEWKDSLDSVMKQRNALQAQLDAMGKGEPEPLYRAAINCPHEIDHEQVILKYDPKQQGHNALNQLGRRLDAAIDAAIRGATT